MSAKRIESELQIRNNIKYSVVTTVEGGKVTKKEYYRHITKEQWEKIGNEFNGNYTNGVLASKSPKYPNDYKLKIGTIIKDSDDNEVFSPTINAGSNAHKLLVESTREMSVTGGNSLKYKLQKESYASVINDDRTINQLALRRESYPSLQQEAIENLEESANILSLDTSKLPLTFKGNRRKTYDLLYYPEDIGSSKQDRIQFKMKYISGSRVIKSNLSDNQNPFSLSKRTFSGIAGSVFLPIPGGITDGNNVKYDNSSMNVITAGLFGAALNPMGTIKSGSELLNKFMNADAQTIRAVLGEGVSQDLISALRIRLAEMATGSDNQFSRIGGGILNPNMELLFQAPGMRTFNFSFAMSARSANEAIQIKKIIRFFKQGMSVKKSSQNIFLVTPNLFEIKYLLGDLTDHPSIGRIKDCALTNLNTTYGDGSTYMTFDDPDRTMTTYKMDMTFQELEPITEDDYTKNDEDKDEFIGY
tara:strand:+ start:225 stop:1646 length:1422 start_codon:yes stop_codon:yes gene_type:complete